MDGRYDDRYHSDNDTDGTLGRIGAILTMERGVRMMLLRPLKLLTGGLAAICEWANGDHRIIPRHRLDGVSSLTYGEVYRAAVALHGPGTKVRIWHDGSGYILPPPPYREEENLYSFEHEFQLRNLLPSLGTMTPKEWRRIRGMMEPAPMFCSMPGCLVTDGLIECRVRDGNIILCPYCRAEPADNHCKEEDDGKAKLVVYNRVMNGHIIT